MMSVASDSIFAPLLIAKLPLTLLDNRAAGIRLNGLANVAAAERDSGELAS